MNVHFMEMIVKIFFLIGAVALPVLIVWLNNRKKINETNQRTQIVLAAIEKNAETDVEDLLKKMAPQKKLLKEKHAPDVILPPARPSRSRLPSSLSSRLARL